MLNFFLFVAVQSKNLKLLADALEAMHRKLTYPKLIDNLTVGMSKIQKLFPLKTVDEVYDLNRRLLDEKEYALKVVS